MSSNVSNLKIKRVNMSKKIIVMLLLILFVLPGCASNGFAKFGGLVGMNIDIPVYRGHPPAEYEYISLGGVRGECTVTSLTLYARAMYVCIEKMADEAIPLGANAIINSEELRSAGFLSYTLIYQGEAVKFLSELPLE